MYSVNTSRLPPQPSFWVPGSVTPTTAPGVAETDHARTRATSMPGGRPSGRRSIRHAIVATLASRTGPCYTLHERATARPQLRSGQPAPTAHAPATHVPGCARHPHAWLSLAPARLRLT